MKYLFGLEILSLNRFNSILSDMQRGIHYEWAQTTNLPEKDFVCGFCGRNITSKDGYTGWFRFYSDQPRQDIYLCHGCGMPNFFKINGEQYPKYKGAMTNFPEVITSLSSGFIEVYKQSELAETEDLKEVSGPGYGKALEFLIKDYLIKLLPEREDEIKKKKLFDCIHELIDNNKIKALAEKARLIRNDETHYERKYQDSDVQDLKKLIGATVAWIELEQYTADVSEEVTIKPITKKAENSNEQA